MDKRYQVFVSSTYEDLIEERQEVMHALLEIDCIPSGMELFPAADDTQWDLIKKVINDCDYYILILAGRYGSIGSEGQSYTEMEYRYALSIEKPIIAFLHRFPGQIIVDKTEKTSDGKEKLLNFRSLVENKLCKTWETKQELGSVVSRSMFQLIKSTPAIGWVRSNEIVDQETTMELLKLKREVEKLNAELAKTRVMAPFGSEKLAQEEDFLTLRYKFYSRSHEGYSSLSFDGSFKVQWNQIFSKVAPRMIHEASDEQFRTSLNDFVEENNLEQLLKMDKFKEHSLKNFLINQEDFQTIKIQLRALGLINKSDKPHSVKDSGTYWSLTPYGDEVMTRLRAIKR